MLVLSKLATVQVFTPGDDGRARARFARAFGGTLT